MTSDFIAGQQALLNNEYPQPTWTEQKRRGFESLLRRMLLCGAEYSDRVGLTFINATIAEVVR